MVTNTGCSTFQSSLVKDFENGIHLGIGGFNLVSSASWQILCYFLNSILHKTLFFLSLVAITKMLIGH